MQLFPNIVQPFVDRAGKILQPFMGYLQQFTIPPPAILAVTVGTSPYSYLVKEPGNIHIAGGTVSNISLIRGSTTLLIASSTANPVVIPVAINDVVKVTYTIKPTINFIPSYGQNTTS